jgi:intracellular sulfur oxidation DsrE/DsrF family protein
MKKDDIVSDDQLNAFVDGELDPEEESRIFTQTEECAELDGRLCQKRKLKELVQHAYRDLPPPGRRHPDGRKPRGLLGLAAAAVLALATGLAGGWLASESLHGRSETFGGVAAAQADTWLLHVASADPERMKAALDRAEALMNEPGAAPGRRVEVVANEGGLNLLRSDVTPFGDRIRALAEKDILFFACSRAIDRLEEQGVRVVLVPEANTKYSALDRVVMRLQEGWTYQKI